MHLPHCLFGDRGGFEAACQAAAQAVYLGDRTLLCRVLTRYLLFADAGEISIVPHLCMSGYWEAWITLALARALRPGAYAIDVGANHGYYALLLAEAAREGGRLLACEPNPHLADLLRRTLTVNGLQGWSEVVGKAVADSSGATARLAIPERQSAGATICRPPQAGEQVIEVQTVTIDELAAAWPRVDLIKIDSEGAEERIWRGMRETVKRCGDLTVILEFAPGRYADPAGFLADIEARGFPLGVVAWDGQVCEVSASELLSGATDWEMLFLRRT
jgi:FkbM family methyltransferase